MTIFSIVFMFWLLVGCGADEVSVQEVIRANDNNVGELGNVSLDDNITMVAVSVPNGFAGTILGPSMVGAVDLLVAKIVVKASKLEDVKMQRLLLRITTDTINGVPAENVPALASTYFDKIRIRDDNGTLLAEGSVVNVPPSLADQVQFDIDLIITNQVKTIFVFAATIKSLGIETKSLRIGFASESDIYAIGKTSGTVGAVIFKNKTTPPLFFMPFGCLRC